MTAPERRTVHKVLHHTLPIWAADKPLLGGIVLLACLLMQISGSWGVGLVAGGALYYAASLGRQRDPQMLNLLWTAAYQRTRHDPAKL